MLFKDNLFNSGDRMPSPSMTRTAQLSLAETSGRIITDDHEGELPHETNRIDQMGLPFGHAEQSAASYLYKKVRLVVVDDHAIVRRGTTSWLSAKACFEVVGEAATAREGVALVKQFKPDVLLLDVGLPGEGSYRAAWEIARDCSYTKVIAFSASSSAADVRGMLTSGAKAYVLKASEADVMVTAIKAVLAGSRFLDPSLTDTLCDLSLFPETGSRCHDVLAPREIEVLGYIAAGYTEREISVAMNIEVTTVNSHKTRVREKLNLRTRQELVHYANTAGIRVMETCAKRPPESALVPYSQTSRTA